MLYNFSKHFIYFYQISIKKATPEEQSSEVALIINSTSDNYTLLSK